MPEFSKHGLYTITRVRLRDGTHPDNGTLILTRSTRHVELLDDDEVAAHGVVAAYRRARARQIAQKILDERNYAKRHFLNSLAPVKPPPDETPPSDEATPPPEAATDEDAEVTNEAEVTKKVSNPQGLVYLAEMKSDANDAAHDQTRQRLFETSFESRDMPESRAANADATDNGRIARGIARDLDEKQREALREMRIRRAAAPLPTRGILRKLFWAICRNGTDRRRTMAELGISECTYWRGVGKFLKIVVSPNEIKGSARVASSRK